MNREWVQTVISVVAILGVAAGFWLSREQELWKAGTEVRALHEEMSSLKSELVSVKKDVRNLARLILRHNVKDQDYHPEELLDDGKTQ